MGFLILCCLHVEVLLWVVCCHCLLMCARPRRITELHHDHSVIYVPNEAWVGSDAFTYATLIGVDESTRVHAIVNVRKCRIDCSNDIINDVAFPTIT